MSSSVLLLTGAVGAGKSDASYRIFDLLWRAGTPAARLDLDDLGMCHPAPDDDPDNHRVKAAVLGASWSIFRERGVQRLVLAGGVLNEAEFALYREQLPDDEWTVVRLRLDDDEGRRTRVRNRGDQLGMTERAIEYWITIGREEEQALDSESFPDHVIDTGDLDRESVTDRVLATVGWR